jgi:hypothetical protein
MKPEDIDRQVPDDLSADWVFKSLGYVVIFVLIWFLSTGPLSFKPTYQGNPYLDPHQPLPRLPEHRPFIPDQPLPRLPEHRPFIPDLPPPPPPPGPTVEPHS